MSSNTPERWLRRFHPSPEAAVRLVLLPHAGGSASFYHPFSQDLAGTADAIVVQYPGRQERLREPGITDLRETAEHLAAALVTQSDHRPVALFGHSMGALLGFEVAYRLQQADIPVPALFVSGRRAPSRHRPPEGVHAYGEKQLLDELVALGGTDPELLDSPELLRMLLPTIRADYLAVENYRHLPRPRLLAPIVGLTGDQDPRVDLDEVAAWAEHTDGSFNLHVFPGGHFYLREERPAVVRAIRDHLGAALRAPLPRPTVTDHENAYQKQELTSC